jgi:hypothetical protein
MREGTTSKLRDLCAHCTIPLKAFVTSLMGIALLLGRRLSHRRNSFYSPVERTSNFATSACNPSRFAFAQDAGRPLSPRVRRHYALLVGPGDPRFDTRGSSCAEDLQIGHSRVMAKP